MYCKKCYAKLDPADSVCTQCGAEFSPSHPETYLRRPFPGASRIFVHVIATTIVGIMAGFVIAFFQMTAASGH